MGCSDGLTVEWELCLVGGGGLEEGVDGEEGGRGGAGQGCYQHRIIGLHG